MRFADSRAATRASVARRRSLIDLCSCAACSPVTPLGTASVPIGIPSAPLLVGQTFTFQWLANQFSANPRAPVASDGLRVTIGN